MHLKTLRQPISSLRHGLACLLLLLPALFPTIAVAGDLALLGGRYFDTDSGTLRLNPGIVVRAGKFHSVSGTTPADTGLPVVELDDEDTILPGIVDLHAHYNVRLFNRRRDETRVNPVVYLANGVTTTFPAGEYDPEEMLLLRRRIERGEQPGPRLLNSGPYFGSARANWRHDISDEELVAEIDHWVGRGVRGFKAKGIRSRQLEVLIERAHHHGLTVTAHLDSGFRDFPNPKDAILMGIDRIEHFLGGDAITPDRRAYESLEALDPNDPRVDEVIDLYVRHGVVFDATLTAYGYFARPLPGYDYWEDERSFFTPYVQAEVARREPEVVAQFGRIFEIKRRTVKKFFDAGGMLTLGTDHFSSGEFLPGFGAHRELEAFTLAGIPNADALRIATLNGARAIGLGDRIGSIEPGKLADAFVIRGNPLADIRVTRTVHTVIKGGRIYRTRELLDPVRGRLGPADAAAASAW